LRFLAHCHSAQLVGVLDTSAQRLRWNLFLGGLAMQISNPKIILFFSASLPQFIDAYYNIPMPFAVMAVLS